MNPTVRSQQQPVRPRTPAPPPTEFSKGRRSTSTTEAKEALLKPPESS